MDTVFSYKSKGISEQKMSFRLHTSFKVVDEAGKKCLASSLR